MNPRPEQTTLHNFGAPPQTTGKDRLKTILMAASGGVLMFCVMYGLHLILPEQYTPGSVAGTIAGQMEKGEIATKAEAQIAYQSGMAAGVAAANTRQQARADALQMQVAGANMADFSCLAGTVIRSLGLSNTGDDLQRAAVQMQGACGVGDAIRDNIAQSQSQVSSVPPVRQNAPDGRR